MLGSILSGLSAAFQAIAAALGLIRQSKDQADGATAQVATDEKETVNVVQAEIAATVADASGPSTADRMRAGSF